MAKNWGPERLDPASYPGSGVDLPVFYNDLDTNGHLNNVAFGRYFEQARLHLHHSLGLRELLTRESRRALVARVAIDYLAEGHLGAPLHVRTRVARFTNRTMVEEQGAWQRDRCVALAEIVVVFAGEHGAEPISDTIRETFAPAVWTGAAEA